MSSGPQAHDSRSESAAPLPWPSSPVSLHSLPTGESMVFHATAYEQKMSPKPTQKKGAMSGVANHTLGLILLSGVILMWTAANFMSSSILSTKTYAKPFFITYLNVAVFIPVMIPTMLKEMYSRHRAGTLRATMQQLFSKETARSFWTNGDYTNIDQIDDRETEAFLKQNEVLPRISSDMPRKPHTANVSEKDPVSKHLGLIPTARLALLFCVLWFATNYFNMVCLQYTTVASATIIGSTSGVWTLLIGAITHTERFTWPKLCGVLASLGGVTLISLVDLSAPATDESAAPGVMTRLSLRAMEDYPDKTLAEVALGDLIALMAAIAYGFYSVRLKQSTNLAAPLTINMPLFFSLVGLFSVILLAPLFPLLHFTGIERFEIPPSSHIWLVLMGISIASLVTDIMWACAMVLTSPLVVTVGLSLNIPLSLVGEMFIQGRYKGWVYWVGALIVVGSFVFVDREEVKEEQRGGTLEGGDDDGESDLTLDEESVGDGGTNKGKTKVGILRSDLLDYYSEDDDEDDVRRDRLQRQADGRLDLDLDR